MEPLTNFLLLPLACPHPLVGQQVRGPPPLVVVVAVLTWRLEEGQNAPSSLVVLASSLPWVQRQPLRVPT